MINIKLIAVSCCVFFANVVAAEPAEVLRDQSCLQFDSDYVTSLSDSNITVNTNSANGNITFMCKSSGFKNDTKKRMVFNFDNTGFTCLGDTNWQQILTPSGQAITRCHTKL